MLTKAEINRYQRDGYVIPTGFRVDENNLSELHTALEEVLLVNSKILPDRMINPHLNGGRPYGIKGHAAFDTIARNARILEMVEAVIGPDIILWLTHLFCKLPETTREVPWHQDGQYWPIRPWATCTVWLALDQVDKSNGAMKVIPGSQERQDWRHYANNNPDLTLNQVIDDEQLTSQDIRYIELEPGQCSIHDVGIVHGSAANASGRRRAGLALRYMPATSGLCRDDDLPDSKFDWSTLPIELLRGENRNPINDFAIGHDCLSW